MARFSATLTRMVLRCKVYSTPGAEEVVNRLLDAGEELRVISAKLALKNIFIDKSSIWRHSQKHYDVRARALRRKEEQMPELRQRTVTFAEIADDALEYSRAHKRGYEDDESRMKRLKEWFGNRGGYAHRR